MHRPAPREERLFLLHTTHTFIHSHPQPHLPTNQPTTTTSSEPNTHFQNRNHHQHVFPRYPGLHIIPRLANRAQRKARPARSKAWSNWETTAGAKATDKLGLGLHNLKPLLSSRRRLSIDGQSEVHGPSWQSSDSRRRKHTRMSQF